MYQLSEKKKRKGWKEHVPGGLRPVDLDTHVKIRIRSGYNPFRC